MLPVNINGDPEYAAIVLTISGPIYSEEGHAAFVTLKTTKTPEEMLQALMVQHGEDVLASKRSTVRMLADGAEADVVYAYRPAALPETLEVVIGSGAYRDLIDHPEFGRGSNFVADKLLLEALAGDRRSVRKVVVGELLNRLQQAA